METSILYALIAKYLTGEASPEEKTIVDDWRNESDNNEILFCELKDSWKMVSDSSQIVIPSKEHVWRRILSRIEATPVVKMYPRQMLLRISAIASVIALLIGLSATFLYVQWNEAATNGTFIVKAPSGQKSEIFLPDGTTVWLNSGTTLSYSSEYNKEKREVQLDGEAYFDVVSDPESEFIVNTANIKVQVLGTSFDVSAYPEDPLLKVSLAEGRVRILSDAGKILTDIIPNKQARINRTDLSFEIRDCDPETESLWRHGKLKIENATMDEIIMKMERWYGVEIQTKGRPSGDHHWLTIKTESLTEMLELINKITPINYSIKGEEVMITYK